MPAEPERELLDLAHPVLLGEGVDGVLLRVGGDDLGVVAAQVRVGEVAAQRARHVQVLDLVPPAVAGDVDQADLRLAVLIVAEGDGHGDSASSRDMETYLRVMNFPERGGTPRIRPAAGPPARPARPRAGQPRPAAGPPPAAGRPAAVPAAAGGTGRRAPPGPLWS